MSKLAVPPIVATASTSSAGAQQGQHQPVQQWVQRQLADSLLYSTVFICRALLLLLVQTALPSLQGKFPCGQVFSPASQFSYACTSRLSEHSTLPARFKRPYKDKTAAQHFSLVGTYCLQQPNSRPDPYQPATQ